MKSTVRANISGFMRACGGTYITHADILWDFTCHLCGDHEIFSPEQKTRESRLVKDTFFGPPLLLSVLLHPTLRLRGVSQVPCALVSGWDRPMASTSRTLNVELCIPPRPSLPVTPLATPFWLFSPQIYFSKFWWPPSPFAFPALTVVMTSL